MWDVVLRKRVEQHLDLAEGAPLSIVMSATEVEHATMVSYGQGLQKTNRGLRKNKREDLLKIRGQESLFEGLVYKQKL